MSDSAQIRQGQCRIEEYKTLVGRMDRLLTERYQVTVGYVTLFIAMLAFAVKSSGEVAQYPLVLLMPGPILVGSFMLYRIDYNIRLISTYIVVAIERHESGLSFETALDKRRREKATDGIVRQRTRIVRFGLPVMCFIANLVVVAGAIWHMDAQNRYWAMVTAAVALPAMWLATVAVIRRSIRCYSEMARREHERLWERALLEAGSEHGKPTSGVSE
ncbi:MAG: hypothetical protein V3T86_17985 [Planctomycetota bacterium]